MLQFAAMKQQYFSPTTIRDESNRMLQQVAYLRRRGFALMPQHSALLVLDMQEYFLEASSHAYVPSAQAIIPGIKALVKAYADRRLPVVFTRHVNTRQDAGAMSKWWRDLITLQDPMSEITAALDVSSGLILLKSQYDAFYQTGLADLLKEKDITQVVIGGVMTHLCCETTARAAFVHGFEVFFTIDGTATYNEDFHRATLLNLAHGFATPLLVDEILTAFQGDDDD